MLLETLKDQIFLPDKEIFLNKHFKIRGVNGILLSLTSQNKKNILWAIYHIPYSNKTYTENPNYLTNKEEMISRISMYDFPNTQLSQVKIQTESLMITSTGMKRLSIDNYETFMQLQHFFENGLSLDMFDNINVSDLFLTSYEFNDNLPSLCVSEELHISLTFSEKSNETLISKPLNIDFNSKDIGKRLSFHEPISKKDYFFYINKVKHYDIWKETENYFKSETAKKLSPEQITELKKLYYSNLEDMCPEGMNLLLIEYETEDNLQLNFYTEEYLNSPPIKNNSLSIMLFKPDEEIGINGFPNRVSSLKPIRRDFKGSTSIELFSFFLTTPLETLHL